MVLGADQSRSEQIDTCGKVTNATFHDGDGGGLRGGGGGF